MRGVPTQRTITVERLKQALYYDPSTGMFVRLESGGGVKAGSMAGWVAQGHLHISIDGEKYEAHRLAWFYMTGKWPQVEIDHEDVDGLNNRWINLREATKGQNRANKRKQKNNTSGFKGVFRHPDGKWQAKIGHQNKQYHLGLFDCLAAAHFCYIVAADKMHGEFARAV